MLLDSVVIFMEKFSIYNISTCIVAIIIIRWTSRHIKNSGKYVEADCKITFSKDKIIWEYIDIDLPIYKGKSHVIYIIECNRIKNISLSNEIESIRVECSPQVKYINEKKIRNIDYRKKNKSCVLIIYNYKLDEIKKLFMKYISKKIDIVD